MLFALLCAVKCLEVDTLDKFEPRKYLEDLGVETKFAKMKTKKVGRGGVWIYGQAENTVFTAFYHPTKPHTVQIRAGQKGDVLPENPQWVPAGSWAVVSTESDDTTRSKVFYKIQEEAEAESNAADANKIIEVAAGEIGYVKSEDPKKGSKYGRWYADYVGESWYGGDDIAYCCMFVTWVMYHAGVPAAGLPSQKSEKVHQAAKKAGTWINKKNAQKGDLVIFDWSGCVDGKADHIGICEVNHPSSSKMDTIEGNTDGGKVKRRSGRSYSNILGCVRPDYAGSTTPVTPETETETETVTKLDVDGHLGKKSIKAWQKALTGGSDGVVSGQESSMKKYHERLESVEYTGTLKSPLVKAIQKFVGVDADGSLGPKTIKAIQKFVGVTADGYIGPDTAKAIQKSLNDGKWTK